MRTTIMIGLCVAMLGACFDGTIVGTIGTKLAEDLGGLSLYSWMATAYLLCETIMIPIAGKLSDIYGRKPLFLIGLGLFAVGSVLAGLSTSMEMFIICRAIQGIGGGILIPVATAAVADLYAPRERARMQGLLGAIFGVGSGIGPLIGGYIEGAISWHWCFYINIPLALIALALTIKKFPTPVSSEEKHVDYKGIAALTLLLLLVILIFESESIGLGTVEIVVMAVAAVIVAAIFVMIERKAIDPILAPHLIHNKTVIMSAIFMAVFGIGMMGAMMYTNMLAVGVFGLTTFQAGIWSLAMVAGMMITSLSSGSLVNRTGYKPWLIAGPILCFIGLYYLSGMAVDSSMGQIYVDQVTLIGSSTYIADVYMTRYLIGTFLLGLGLGCMMSVVMSAVQNSSKPTEMGMTTSSVNLIRSIGTTMGTAIFTMVINSRLSGELSGSLPDAIYNMIPHDTGVLSYAFMFPGTNYGGSIISAFSDSVDFAFLVGGIILLLLVIVGIIFKAQKPEEDEEFEAIKKRIESGE